MHVNVFKAVQLGAETPEHRVICVAGVTGFLSRYAMILKVRRCQISGIIDVQALSERLHFVAGKAKLRALGTVDVIAGAHSEADERQQKQHKEGEYLSCLRAGHAWAKDEHADQNRTDRDQR